MTGDTTPGSRSVVCQLLESYCAGKGLSLTTGDPHGHAGYVENRSGRRWFFKGTRFDLNPYGAAEIANDKAYACRFLKEAGIAVPASHFVQGDEVRTGKRPPEDVLDFAEDTGFPLYVKPNEGQEGRGVMRVDTYHTLQSALTILAKSHPAMLVQEEIRGTDLRVLVLDGEVLCAFERHAPQVTGDGTSSLAELVDAHPGIDPSDGRIDFELSQQALMLESVPEAGQTVALLPVSNLFRRHGQDHHRRTHPRHSRHGPPGGSCAWPAICRRRPDRALRAAPGHRRRGAGGQCRAGPFQSLPPGLGRNGRREADLREGV